MGISFTSCAYRRPLTRFLLPVLVLNGVVLFGLGGSAFSDTPRTIAEAVEILSFEISKIHDAVDLKPEFIDATYVGANRRFDAQFRNGATILRARLNPDGTIVLTDRMERNEKRVSAWQAAEGLEGLPDLDQQLATAESTVRAEGFQPIGVALLKYVQRAGRSKPEDVASTTRVFFEIADSEEARVVEFDNETFRSHRSGKLLQIPLPVIRTPKITPPEIEPPKIDPPQLQSPAFEAFRTPDNETLVRIDGDFLFDFDKDQPRPEAEKLLPGLAELLLEENPSIITVEGHTDSWGTPQYNDNLSRRRAESIADRLRAAGVPGDKFVTKGYGESRPIAPEVKADGSDDPQGRQRNRRVEVRFR